MSKRRKLSAIDSLFVERDGALFFFPSRRGKGIPCTAVDRERVIELFRQDIQRGYQVMGLTLGVWAFALALTVWFAVRSLPERFPSFFEPAFLMLLVTSFLPAAAVLFLGSIALGRAKNQFAGRDATASPMTEQEIDYAKRLSIAAQPETEFWAFVAIGILVFAIGVARQADSEPLTEIGLVQLFLGVFYVCFGAFGVARRRKALRSL